VYGIDLDNRLVKTAKVSAFFNGDGEANIIWANGLDSFTKSKAFRGKLVGAKEQDNGKFDLLISNPPYSVDAFKSTIKYGEESFELYSGLTDNSSEIECLFVERMKQLLKIGGWAAVILPSSILTNSGIHAKARTILLKYFKIMAIVEAGSNTFMKTNTNTVILFLKRRSNDDYLNISHAIERFFSNYEDVVVSGIESAFSIFVSNVYNELTFEDYISLFKGKPTREARSHELYKDYMKSFGDGFCTKAIENEKDKMLYFLLTYKQTVVLVKTGKGKEEKKFLGYEFSERRGHEGLHHLSGGTKLYDESDSLNPQKVSSYIYRAFLGETAEIDESLADNLSYARMSHFIEYGTSRFEKNINLGKPTSYLEQIRNKFVKFPMQRLNEISTMIRRGRSADYGDSGIQIIKS
ncbi:MAG: N-6 DNA methylase, partial [Lachnospiraceae bacterium]|nr:N-6 DNA methylase [Lachnospiraceae bacterium]